jgi:two-component system, chemotaxis family, CheB/CheR fusion protein
VLETGIEYRIAGEVLFFDVLLTPMGGHGDWVGVNVSFTDVTSKRRLKSDLERSAHDLETAYEELQATNEELETTNEELQSTVEELETTNEELQSTNEELETMNEELQSTNEELETINEELRRRTDDLNSVNVYMDSIMASLRYGVVVTDTNQNIRLWNPRAEDLWGLRYEEVVGRSLFGLDIGLPVEKLRKPIKATMERDGGHEETTLSAINRRGRQIDCRVNLTRLLGSDRTPMGVIMFMEEIPNDSRP